MDGNVRENQVSAGPYRRDAEEERERSMNSRSSTKTWEMLNKKYVMPAETK